MSPFTLCLSAPSFLCLRSQLQNKHTADPTPCGQTLETHPLLGCYRALCHISICMGVREQTFLLFWEWSPRMWSWVIYGKEAALASLGHQQFLQKCHEHLFYCLFGFLCLESFAQIFGLFFIRYIFTVWRLLKTCELTSYLLVNYLQICFSQRLFHTPLIFSPSHSKDLTLN